MTIQLLALIGLVIGAALYALLVRRRGAERLDHVTMSRALTASNEIALARMREAPRARAEAIAGIDERTDPAVIVPDRRSGGDRRASGWSAQGRGRRSGGDRRRSVRR